LSRGGASKCLSRLVASTGTSIVDSVGVIRFGFSCSSPVEVKARLSATILDRLVLLFLSSVAAAAGPLDRATRAAVDILLGGSRERGSWGDLEDILQEGRVLTCWVVLCVSCFWSFGADLFRGSREYLRTGLVFFGVIRVWLLACGVPIICWGTELRSP